MVGFDDERAVANAGVMPPALLAGRLGIEQLVEDAVDLGDHAGAANPGRKVMTMISAMALGADCIEDCDVLRSGRTARWILVDTNPGRGSGENRIVDWTPLREPSQQVGNAEFCPDRPAGGSP